jgi:hypothetical protein
VDEHRVRDREPLRSLFSIQSWFSSGVAGAHGMRRQLLGIGQGLGRARRHRVDLRQKLAEIMCLVEAHAVAHEEGFQRLLGRLLGVEADEIVGRHLPAEDEPSGEKILSGPGEPCENEVPAALLRRSRTAALPR